MPEASQFDEMDREPAEIAKRFGVDAGLLPIRSAGPKADPLAKVPSLARGGAAQRASGD